MHILVATLGTMVDGCERGMYAPITAGAMTIIMAPISGILCERFGRRQTMMVSRLLSIVVIVPAFLYIVHERTVSALIISLVVLAMVGMPASVAAVTVMAEVFPTESRGAGIALTYAAAVTIFGATTQFVVTWLLDVTGDPMAPAYYSMGAAVLSVGAILILFRYLAQRDHGVVATS